MIPDSVRPLDGSIPETVTMAKTNTAWGIEIGQYAIKAIQLESTAEGIRVRDFAVIPHLQVLTDPELEAEGEFAARAKIESILEMSLSQLATQKQLAKQKIVVSFSWIQNRGFARFARLPAVLPKEIPNLVRYEVEQQIPFPESEIEWDFHAFASEDSPEIEVGLFAIQKEPLEEFLALVAEKLGIEPASVTLSPLALYNALVYDLDLESRDEPFVFLDIGTSSTDLVVAHGTRCWMRTFPLGGHSFTEAIAEEFKAPYRTADAVKQESATHKHAKQIMSAMRPVFADLIGDVQKSLSFYESQNRGTQLRRVVGLGSTMKIPGLRKFIGMQLNLEVDRLDGYSKLSMEGPESVDFAQHAVNFAVAYGLALQGLGLAPVEINLLPLKSIRQQVWSRKTRWFAAAAGVACAAGALMFARGVLDKSALGDVSAVNAAQGVVSLAKKNQSDLTSSAADIGSLASNMTALLEDREVWPFIVSDAISAIAAGNDGELVGDDLAALAKASPTRKQTVLRDLAGVYKSDASGARVIEVTLDVEFIGPDRDKHLGDTVCAWLRENKVRADAPYEILDVSPNVGLVTSMKAGKDGALEGSGSDAGTATGSAGAGAAGGAGGFGAPAAEGGLGGSFTVQGDDGSSNFGGVSGRRQSNSDTQISRPGGLLGGAGSGGGFNAGNTGSDPAYGPRGGSSGFGAPAAGTPQAPAGGSEKVDLDKIAPLPARPDLYPEGATVYVGKVTFKVKLKGAVAAAPSSEEIQ